jgi:ribosome-binding ATPase YchF (GTP1/OBG family)
MSTTDLKRHLLRTYLNKGPSSAAGAYQGRGRGNAFLNDLCDADVLVHVVDVSGTTDREGAAVPEGEGADPCDDIR